MQQKEKSNKKLFIAVGAFVILVAIFLAIFFFTRPAVAGGEKKITVEVIQLDGSSKESVFRTDAEYLAEALNEQNMIGGDETGFGFMVTSVNGVLADTEKQQWWMLTVDGEFSNYGISDLPVTDGGHYEFTLVEGWD